MSREPRLAELLDRIREDDRASYAYYTDPEQLAELVRGDLATLLAERFTRASSPVDEPLASMDGAVELPAALTSLIGRERELEAVVDLLSDDDVRLVTLTGPGGIGKSRLSIDAANRVHDRFPGGIAFVDLSPSPIPGSCPRPSRTRSASSTSATARSTRNCAWRCATDACCCSSTTSSRSSTPRPPSGRSSRMPRTSTVLATSRILLRVSGEHGMELGPLALPDMRHGASVGRALAGTVGEPLRRAGARREARLRAHRRQRRGRRTHLHRPRRRAARNRTGGGAGSRADARRAAGAPRPAPPRARRRRARPARAAAHDPLHDRVEHAAAPPSEQELLARLGLFAGGFTLDAAEWIAEGIPDADTLDDLAALVDGSLVRQQDRGDRAVFSMLSTVREYALDQLDERPDARRCATGTRSTSCGSASRRSSSSREPTQIAWIDRLSEEGDNLRATARHLLDTRPVDDRRALRLDALRVLVGRRAPRRGARLDAGGARLRRGARRPHACHGPLLHARDRVLAGPRRVARARPGRERGALPSRGRAIGGGARADLPGTRAARLARARHDPGERGARREPRPLPRGGRHLGRGDVRS